MGKFNLLTTLSVDSTGMKAGLEAAASATRSFASGVEGESKKISFAFRDTANMGVGELRKELVALRNTKLTGYTDVEVKAINMRVGELVDTMGDLKATQKGMGTEFGNLATQGIQGMAGLAEAGLGVAMVFGMDKEAAAKYQSTMVGVMGAVQGLGAFQEMLGNRTLQVLAIRIKDTVATAAQTVATTAATAAQWLYNASLLVIIGTIGAVVVVVAAVAYGIYALTQGYDEQAEAVAKLREEKEALIKVSEGEGKAVDHQIKLMQAEGKEAADIKRMEIAAAQIKRENAKNEHDNYVALFKLKALGGKATEEEEKGMAEQKKIYDDLGATLEIYGAELTVLSNKKEKHVGVIKAEDSALKKWIETANAAVAKSKELAQFDVPIPSMGQSGAADVPVLASKGSKGITTKPDPKPDPIKLQVRSQVDLTKAIKNSNSEMKKQVESMGAMRDLMSGFGEAAANAFGEQSAAAKAFAVGAIIANAAMAIMGTWAGYAKFGPWGTALAVAQTAMIAGIAITQVGNVTGAFADGGIVPGTSLSGDNLTARVNSGEMILNQAQQGQLFALANGGGSGGGEVVFRIEGTTLVGVLNNHGRKINNTR